MTAGTGNDTFIGGEGNDSLVVGESSWTGFKTFTGGSGTDEIRLAESGGDGYALVDNDFTGMEFETLNLTSAAQAADIVLGRRADTATANGLTITATSAADTITAGANFDNATTITSADGGDVIDFSSSSANLNYTSTSTAAHTITLGSGTNIIDISAGTTGDTVTTSSGTDSILAGTGADTIVISNGDLTTADTITGGATGANRIVIDNATTLVDADFTNVTQVSVLTGAVNDVALTATLSTEAIEAGIVEIYGATSVANEINASGQTNAVTILGGDAADSIDGGSGADTINGGAGADTISGGSGNDTISTGTGADIIDAGAGDDVVLAAATGANSIHGGAGIDSITGGTGADTLIGGEGADTIDGSTGADQITLTETTAAADIIQASSVDAGSWGADTITGFASGSDAIRMDGTDVSGGVAADSGLAAGDAAVWEVDELNSNLVGDEAFAIATIFGFVTTDTHVSELVGGNTSQADLAGDTDGTELMKLLAVNGSTATSITTSAADDKFLVVAYDGGNAYLYHLADAGSDGSLTVAGGEITQIGTFESISDGGLASGDIILNA